MAVFTLNDVFCPQFVFRGTAGDTPVPRDPCLYGLLMRKHMLDFSSKTTIFWKTAKFI